jgi:hypothetical protein
MRFLLVEVWVQIFEVEAEVFGKSEYNAIPHMRQSGV